MAQKVDKIKKEDSKLTPLEFLLRMFKWPILLISGATALNINGINLQYLKYKDLEVKLTKFDVDKSNMEENIKAQVLKTLSSLKGINTSPVIQTPPNLNNLPNNVSRFELLLQEQIKPVNDSISNDLAQKTIEKKKSIYKDTEGFIWLGDFNTSTNSFSKLRVNSSDLNTITIGNELVVQGNMNIRESNPITNKYYYEGETKIGIAAKGTKVRILETPQIKVVTGLKQYWAKVKILE